MKKALKSILSIAIAGMILVSCLVVYSYDYSSVIDGAINWGVNQRGSKLIETAGSGENDWLLIAMARSGYNLDKASVIAATENYVSKKYQSNGKLSSTKATEWHRVALLSASLGVDPQNFGGADLIADGVYNRGNTVSLGKQGVNGWIWGLISLDSLRFHIPNGSYYSRDDIIVEILRQQLADGGFSLYGNNADADITAMAIIALSTYYNNETEYTYENDKTKSTVTKSVRNVVDESLSALSVLQNGNGTYSSWGVENAESTSQVIVALCSLGINPEADSRFSKNGHNAVDGLMNFKNKDGGFVHSHTEDSNNKYAVPGESNIKATEQALCAMEALVKYKNGMRNLYDMRAEQSSEIKNSISNLVSKINNLNSYSLNYLLDEYNSIPQSEQSYVYNYYKLSDALKLQNGEKLYEVEKSNAVKQTSASGTVIDENAIFSTGENKSSYTKSNSKESTEKASDEELKIEKTAVKFTSEDMAAYNSLPDEITTEYSIEVLRLLNILSQCDDFEGKAEMVNKLNEYKEKIDAIEKEISSINIEIQEKLYPLENLNLFDYLNVHSIMKRINSLSEYDKTKITALEDVNRAIAEVNSSLRAVLIFIACIIVFVVLIIILTLRYKKRKIKKDIEQMLSERYDFKDMNV